MIFELVLFARLHLGIVGPAAVAPAQALFGQLSQGAFVGLPLRDGKVGQVEAPILQIDLAHLGDAQGVGKHARRQVGQRPEGIAHLLAALEIIAAIGHPHAVRLFDRGAGLHAKQHVVVAGILRFDVVYVVGNHQSHFVPAGPVQQRLVDLAQGRDVVLLQLDEEAILAEDVYIPLQTFQSQLGLLL